MIIKVFEEFKPTQDKNFLEKEFNFRLIPDGNNSNYRSAQIPINYLSDVIDKYNIKTIIRFNRDSPNDSRNLKDHPSTLIKDEEKLCKDKKINFHRLSSTKDQETVNKLLNQGNVLIHCAHGADRTGGNVGGYLYTKGWDTKKIWDYTTQYNDWKNLVTNKPTTFIKKGYLDQAKKFGVKDINHAKSLIKK